MISDTLKKSVRDLRYLLNRGYPRSSAVEYVSDHYQLELDDRHLLARCVFSEDEIQDHRKRLIEPSEASDCIIGLDGYNVLITVETIMKGGEVVRCDDGFVRDLEAVFGSYNMKDSTEESILKILEVLDSIRPEEVTLLFDKQVSKSGELAGFTRHQMEEMDLNGDARTTVGTDAKVWKFEVSASSDRVVIERSEKVLDLPSEFLKENRAELIDLKKV